MRLKTEVGFDPQAELAAIADFARRWRSLFRPAEVAYTPAHFTAELEKLQQAKRLRLYLVTRPEAPVAPGHFGRPGPGPGNRAFILGSPGRRGRGAPLAEQPQPP